MMKSRRRDRGVAMQALYEIDWAHHDPEIVLTERIAQSELPPAHAAFVRTLVLGVLDNLQQIDRYVREVAPEWPVEQMSPIDLNILRIAVFEYMIERKTPVKVIINEAVELAKLFGGDSTRRFVNGALGALVSRYAHRSRGK
ncbi:MAG: transcription antitermination factor NusB [Chloroflexi bacterium]|nr:transcription antitermination factor NusB [Chloroflexota bacterium]